MIKVTTKATEKKATKKEELFSSQPRSGGVVVKIKITDLDTGEISYVTKFVTIDELLQMPNESKNE